MREIRTDIGALMPIIEEKLARGGEVLFSPNGVSMLPTLRPGEDPAVLVSPPERLRKYDIALFRIEGRYVMHRVIAVGDTYTFIGDNCTEFERGVATGDVVALCTARIRGGKRVSLSSRRARARAWVRYALRPLRRFASRVKRKLGSLLKK